VQKISVISLVVSWNNNIDHNIS